MSTTHRRGCYAIRIEGVCKAVSSGADGRYRFVWSAGARNPCDLSWDSDGLYQEGLLGWPRERLHAVDWLGAGAQVGGQTYRLRATPLLLTALWTLRAGTLSRLSGAISSAATTIAFTTAQHASLQNTVVYLEREVIRVGTLASTISGVSTYINCVRGYAGSLALPHGQEDVSDRAVFATQSADSLRGRLVELVFLPHDATGLGDEQLEWRGVLSEVNARDGELEVEVSNLLQALQGTLLLRDQWRSRLDRPARRRPDAGYTGARMGAFLVDGQYAVRAPWRLVGGGYQIDLTRATTLRGCRALPDDLPPDAEVVELLGAGAELPGNGASPATAALPLSSSPAICALQLLTTTAAGGVTGSNGVYDTGIDNLAGEVRADLVDVAAWLAWGERYGWEPLERLALGESGPVDLYEVIQRQILQPRGATLTQGADGRLRPSQLTDTPAYGATAVITQAQVISVGRSQSRRLQQALDRIVVSHNHRPGVGADTVDSIDAYKRRRLPRGSLSTLEVDAGATGSQDAAVALSVGLLARFHRPPPALWVEVLRTADHWPGDVVRLTHPRLLANGAEGLSGATCLVVGRQELINGPELGQSGEGFRHTIGLSLLYVGGIYNQQGLLGPSARVASYSAQVFTVEASDFVTSTSPAAFDARLFAADDVVQLLDQYGTLREAGLVVDSVTDTTISITSAPSVTPAAGDILVPDQWSAQVEAQRALWASLADTSDQLGGDEGNTYSYVTG